MLFIAAVPAGLGVGLIAVGVAVKGGWGTVWLIAGILLLVAAFAVFNVALLRLYEERRSLADRCPDPALHASMQPRVVRAEYGVVGTWRDVTELVIEAVQSNELNLLVSNANLGGDPAPEVGKSLRIAYVRAGEVVRDEFPESSIATFRK